MKGLGALLEYAFLAIFFVSFVIAVIKAIIGVIVDAFKGD